MNKKAVKLHRGNIENCPINLNSDTDNLIKEIIEKTNQTAINKADEVAVMRSMLNDKEFKVGVWDKSKGFVGTRSPREEAIGLAVDTLSGATGMSTVEAQALSENYEFTKRDATRLINLSKDFIGTYLQSGRKIQIISEPRGESNLDLRYMEGGEKSVPDRDNPGKTKVVSVEDCIKLHVSNKR